MQKLFLFVAGWLLVSGASAAEWQYGPRAGAALDLQLPSGAGPFPLVIAIHGGGWESGSRAEALPFCRIILASGFACAAVDYRLAPRAQFPAPVDDITEAVAFLQSKGSQLKIIPGRFILAGESAGGHLATLAAIRSGGSGIAGVAVFSGAFDLAALSQPSRPLNVIPEQISQLLGIHSWTAETIARMQEASPTFLINPRTPPILVIRGAEDRLVPAAQASAFCDKALALAVPCAIATIPQAKHGLWGEVELDRFSARWSGLFVEWAGKLATSSTP